MENNNCTSMTLLFVHGWGADIASYGQLPQIISDHLRSTSWRIEHLYLGQYISVNDEVDLDDIANAFELAKNNIIGDSRFSVICHSTGAVVIRHWLQRYFSADQLQRCPLKHLIMLAPANHGSALAQLGQSRLSRVAAWFKGHEPGIKILHWLELASLGQWQTNRASLDYDLSAHGIYCAVLTGETIDKSLYDYLNSYTAEPGSDGVVRSAAANMNYCYWRVEQQLSVSDGYRLSMQQMPISAFEVLPKTSHSGKRYGIMSSITRRNYTNKPLLKRIQQILQVDSFNQYIQLTQAMLKSGDEQSRSQGYAMLVLRVWDDKQQAITDFDCILLAGKEYRADKFGRGFLSDKQFNQKANNGLTFYFNMAKLGPAKQYWGFKIIARPDQGICFYQTLECHFSAEQQQVLIAQQTLIIDLVLKRQLSTELFTFQKKD